MTSSPYIEQIWLDKITDADLICLQKAVEVCYTGHRVEDVLRGLSRFELQLWRGINGPDTFSIITRIVQYPGGKQLEVWSIGGKGYVRSVEQVYGRLKEFAKESSCRWFAVTIERKAFLKLYKRFPKMGIYTLMVQEV